MKPLKEKKPFQAPHTFVILVVLILLAVAATYVVPAGEYTRYTDEATNRTLVEAGSFHYVESHPVSFLTVPALIYRAIVKAASTVTFILIIGGSFEIITSTGILTVLCKKMAKAFRGREYFVIPAFLLLFSVFGTTMGMSAEVMIFVPIGDRYRNDRYGRRIRIYSRNPESLQCRCCSGYCGDPDVFRYGIPHFYSRSSSGDRYGLHYLVRKARESGPDKEYHLRRA